MKFLTTIVAFLIASIGLFAGINIRSIEQIQIPGDVRINNARWSPDGRYIAFTDQKYHGLQLFDSVSKTVTTLSDYDGAGYGYQWSHSGHAIAARVSETRNRRRYSAVAIINIPNGDINFICDFKTMLPGVPIFSNNDALVYMNGSNRKTYFNTGLKNDADLQPSVVRIKDELAVISAPSAKLLRVKPMPGRYLNVVASPDAKHVAFQVIGVGLFISDASGTNLRSLGNGSRPQWSADSQWLTYFIAHDDGQRYLDSDIYMASAEGKSIINLTENFEEMAFNPSFAPQNTAIIFNTPDGLLFEIKFGVN